MRSGNLGGWVLCGAVDREAVGDRPGMEHRARSVGCTLSSLHPRVCSGAGGGPEAGGHGERRLRADGRGTRGSDR